MFQVTPQMRILVGIEAVDGRKGIDSLAQLCRGSLSYTRIWCTAGKRCSGLEIFEFQEGIFSFVIPKR